MTGTTSRAVLPRDLDPELDLALERVVPVPREVVWRAWTVPENLKQWFTPAPWTTVEAELDLRPGGIFRTVMRSPEGQRFDNVGCYLEVLPDERLIWTNALAPGLRPAGGAGAGSPGDAHFAFTCVLTLAAEGAGTRYRALVMHASEASRRKHEQMGFQEGWGKALDQLVAAAKGF